MTDTPRSQSGCVKCGQTDDHPKHRVSVTIGDPATGKPVELDFARHKDCCAAEGCGVCATELEFAGGAHGLELAAALAVPGADLARALAERHGAETAESIGQGWKPTVNLPEEA